jgi:hypothetical protein
MRRDSKTDPRKAKQIARQKYAERQIDKYINWSIEQRGLVKYKDIVEIQNKYNIKCYG